MKMLVKLTFLLGGLNMTIIMEANKSVLETRFNELNVPFCEVDAASCGGNN